MGSRSEWGIRDLRNKEGSCDTCSQVLSTRVPSLERELEWARKTIGGDTKNPIAFELKVLGEMVEADRPVFERAVAALQAEHILQKMRG